MNNFIPLSPISESLRKYPALPFITRECVKDYKIQGTEVIIDKGTLVAIPIKAIHYAEKYFENPQKFDPDRFRPENKEKRHRYSHLPFGEGQRMCIGMYKNQL